VLVEWGLGEAMVAIEGSYWESLLVPLLVLLVLLVGIDCLLMLPCTVGIEVG
jgi:hypothetical protein